MPSKKEKDDFSLMIEEEAQKKKISHIDMIVDYCEKYNMELEVAGSLLNSNLKDKVEHEARKLRYLPGNSTLQIDG